MIVRIKARVLHFIVALGLLFTGITMNVTPDLYMWPPFLKDIANGPYIGWGMIALGCSILLWMLFSDTSDGKWDTVNLVLSALIMGTLAVYQFTHFIHTGFFSPWAVDAAMTGVIVYLAYRGDDLALD